MLRSQTAFLAQALRLVARDGYTWWQVQTTPTEKAVIAVKRLDEKWAVLLDRPARNVRREARLPVVHALPGGGWQSPPWKAAFREWPTNPLSPIGMRLYPEEPPRTLGEWMAMRRSG